MKAGVNSDDSQDKHDQIGYPPVQVWRVSLDLPERVVSRLEKSLNPDELQRSAQFRLPEYRRRYAIARGALRSILGRHMNIAPSEVVFGYGSHGKPFVAYPLERLGLHFNVAHTVDIALIAAVTGHRVGIDIERHREIPDLDHIIERYFNDEEKAFIRSMTNEEQLKRFLTLWTRKEATAKAFGLDLMAALTYLKIPVYPMGDLVTSVLAAQYARIDQAGNTRCTIRDLHLDSSHAGALCVEGGPFGVIFRDFESPSCSTIV
jgi:4'-phosphopantetheinyl transferase